MSNQRRIILILILSAWVALMIALFNAQLFHFGISILISFIGLIGILFYSYFEESNVFFQYYSKHKLLKNYDKSVLFIYVKLLESDGNVSADELRNAKKIIKKDFGKRYKPEHFEFLKSSIGKEVNIKLPVRDIFENFGSSFCMLFINNLVKLAATDSIMTVEEEQFIRNIGRELKISSRAIDSIFERHSFILESERKGKSFNKSSVLLKNER